MRSAYSLTRPIEELQPNLFSTNFQSCVSSFISRLAFIFRIAELEAPSGRCKGAQTPPMRLFKRGSAILSNSLCQSQSSGGPHARRVYEDSTNTESFDDVPSLARRLLPAHGVRYDPTGQCWMLNRLTDKVIQINPENIYAPPPPMALNRCGFALSRNA